MKTRDLIIDIKNILLNKLSYNHLYKDIIIPIEIIQWNESEQFIDTSSD